jgi:hypothetical protein
LAAAPAVSVVPEPVASLSAQNAFVTGAWLAGLKEASSAQRGVEARRYGMRQTAMAGGIEIEPSGTRTRMIRRHVAENKSGAMPDDCDAGF